MTSTQQPAPADAAPSAAGPVGPALVRWPVALVVVVAVVVALSAGLLSGALAAPIPGLGDPGPLVRFGLPVTRVLADLSAALTVGLLVLAATVIPEARTTSRRIVATRAACASGVAWLVAGLVHVVFAFADIALVPVGDADFGAQFRRFVLDLPSLRVEVISLAVVLVVTTGAAVARTRAAMVALAAGSVLAVLPLALAGHAAGSAAHDTAVDSLAVHLVATVVWVGGLLALLVLGPVLRSALAVSVARYSTLAGWCFAAVAISGALGAWVRVGDLAALTSAYGALLLLKSVALLALGVAGWRHRRAMLPRLADGEGSKRAFARLALAEVVVMSAAFGVATALARTTAPVSDTAVPDSTPVQSLTGYPAPTGPLTAQGWLTVWRPDWLWVALACLAVGLYVAGVLRLRRRGDAWPVGRTIVWVIGWAVFVWATSGAPGVYGRLLFSVHMVMHMVVAMVVPILLVLAAPVTLAVRALPARPDRTLGPRELLLGLVHSRLLRVLGNPVAAAALFFAGLVVFYYSGLFELALRTHTGHVLMVLHFLLTGYLFAWVMVGVDPGPRRWAPPLRLLILFATISFHAFLGVALTTQSTLLAPDFYQQLQLPWPVDLLADQQAGGAVAWGVGELPTLALALLVTLAWLRSDTAESTRRDRQADRDGDAELNAYNAALAARSAADRRSPSAGA